MKIDVRIKPRTDGGSTLADANVTLDGCFAVRAFVRSGNNGPFVAMPSHKHGDKYEDQCFPCTKEFRSELFGTILSAYEQKMAESPKAVPTNEMTMSM